MFYLKFYWFVRTAKWKRRDSVSFFNKKKGITLCLNSYNEIVIKTNETRSIQIKGLAAWLTIRYFKNINNKIKKQEKKEEKKQEKQQIKNNKQKEKDDIISALNRQCYVEIDYDRDNRADYKVKEWLDEKEYSYEKLTGTTKRNDNHMYGVGIYYFENKSHATEFKMVFGGEN